MAKYKNRYGEVIEFDSLEKQASKFYNSSYNTFTAYRVLHNWYPFLYKEIKEQEAPQIGDEFIDRTIKDFWQHMRYRVSRYNIGGNAFSKNYESLLNGLNVQDRLNAINKIPKGTINYLTNSFFYKTADMKLRDYLIALERIYSYDPEKERQQKEAVAQKQVENARIKEFDTHIQQLNKNLEVSHQQNSILQKNVDFLKNEQNRIVNETKKSFEQQANKLVEYNTQTQNAINQLSQESQKAFNKTQEDTSRAFIKFQKTVENNFRERGEAYDRNLQNFRESAENELSYIKQNHGVLMEKLQNRIRKRMLSDAPEFKTSYNFFADIFAGNK